MKNSNKFFEDSSKSKTASIFLNPDEIVDLIKDAEKIQPTLQANGRFCRIVDAGRIIGIDGSTGRPTSLYVVITDDKDNLVTTYPVGDKTANVQYIKIIMIDEEGNILKSSEVNFADILNEVEKIHDYKILYPWITSIDPYGNTILNKAQISLLLKELKKIYKFTEKSKLKEIIERLIIFLEKVTLRHSIKFLGD